MSFVHRTLNALLAAEADAASAAARSARSPRASPIVTPPRGRTAGSGELGSGPPSRRSSVEAGALSPSSARRSCQVTPSRLTARLTTGSGAGAVPTGTTTMAPAASAVVALAEENADLRLQAKEASAQADAAAAFVHTSRMRLKKAAAGALLRVLARAVLWQQQQAARRVLQRLRALAAAARTRTIERTMGGLASNALRQQRVLAAHAMAVLRVRELGRRVLTAWRGHSAAQRAQQATAAASAVAHWRIVAAARRSQRATRTHASVTLARWRAIHLLRCSFASWRAAHSKALRLQVAAATVARLRTRTLLLRWLAAARSASETRGKLATARVRLQASARDALNLWVGRIRRRRAATLALAAAWRSMEQRRLRTLLQAWRVASVAAASREHAAEKQAATAARWITRSRVRRMLLAWQAAATEGRQRQVKVEDSAAERGRWALRRWKQRAAVTCRLRRLRQRCQASALRSLFLRWRSNVRAEQQLDMQRRLLVATTHAATQHQRRVAAACLAAWRRSAAAQQQRRGVEAMALWSARTGRKLQTLSAAVLRTAVLRCRLREGFAHWRHQSDRCGHVSAAVTSITRRVSHRMKRQVLLRWALAAQAAQLHRRLAHARAADWRALRERMVMAALLQQWRAVSAAAASRRAAALVLTRARQRSAALSALRHWVGLSRSGVAARASVMIAAVQAHAAQVSARCEANEAKAAALKTALQFVAAQRSQELLQRRAGSALREVAGLCLRRQQMRRQLARVLQRSAHRLALQGLLRWRTAAAALTLMHRYHTEGEQHRQAVSALLQGHAFVTARMQAARSVADVLLALQACNVQLLPGVAACMWLIDAEAERLWTLAQPTVEGTRRTFGDREATATARHETVSRQSSKVLQPQAASGTGGTARAASSDIMRVERPLSAGSLVAASACSALTRAATISHQPVAMTAVAPLSSLRWRHRDGYQRHDDVNTWTTTEDAKRSEASAAAAASGSLSAGGPGGPLTLGRSCIVSIIANATADVRFDAGGDMAVRLALLQHSRSKAGPSPGEPVGHGDARLGERVSCVCIAAEGPVSEPALRQLLHSGHVEKEVSRASKHGLLPGVVLELQQPVAVLQFARVVVGRKPQHHRDDRRGLSGSSSASGPSGTGVAGGFADWTAQELQLMQTLAATAVSALERAAEVATLEASKDAAETARRTARTVAKEAEAATREAETARADAASARADAAATKTAAIEMQR